MPGSRRVKQQQWDFSRVPCSYGFAVFQLDRLRKSGHNTVPLVLIPIGQKHRLPVCFLQNVLQGIQLFGMQFVGLVILVINCPARNLQQFTIDSCGAPGVNRCPGKGRTASRSMLLYMALTPGGENH